MRRAAAVALLAVLVGGLASSHGGSAGARRSSAGARRSSAAARRSSTAASAARYGGLPSWLPKPKVPVNRVLTASEAHPALSIQGDSVSVELPRGRVLATAVGPETPRQGRFPVPATSPCTFIVTFTAARGSVPLSPRAFTLVDEFGRVRHPRVTAMDGGPPPRRAQPGHSVSLRVYDVLPTGDGGLRWAPEGPRPLVAWDFVVEID
jgi:hypothetical protein